MQKHSFDELSSVEYFHWYFDHRHKLVEFYLSAIAKEKEDSLNILDVGCGTGGMLGLLQKYGKVTGIDASDYAVALSQKKFPGVCIRAGSANDLEKLFNPAQFDLVAIFNVLYHQWVNDDANTLKQAAKIIKKGGYLILVEPAFKSLFRDNDKVCLGKRRYTIKQISKLLLESGFAIEENTYFNAISFFPILLLALLQRFNIYRNKDVSPELRPAPWIVNETIKCVISLERFWIKVFKKMPLGVSLLAMAKRTD